MRFSRASNLSASSAKLLFALTQLLLILGVIFHSTFSFAQGNPEPLSKVNAVRRLPADRAALGYPVCMQGIVTYNDPDWHILYVQDDSGGINVELEQHEFSLRLGQRVEVRGISAPGSFLPVVSRARLKPLSAGPPPQPRALPDARALNNNFHGDLVRVLAKLVDQWQSTDGRRYLLQDLSDTRTTFEALLENSSYSSATPVLRNGSELELTGIYLLWAKGTQEHGFQLLLRTPEDIRLLKNPPWWTMKHTYWSFGILFGLILSASAWAAMLKVRVNRQTAIIQNRLEVEAALGKKYQELFERSNDIVFACDLGGRLTSINPAGVRILGYDSEELLAMDFCRLVVPKSLPQIREWVELKLKGIECPNLECELLAKDGHSVLLEVSGEILQSDGQPVGAHGIARDITERKHAEEALRRSEEKLRQGQKLEAIQRLAGGIAHDFNNILTAMLGYAEMSVNEIPPEHPIRANIEQILKAGKRARGLVQQILAFGRRLEQERHPIQIQTILDEELKLLRATLPATIEIGTKIDPECSPVLADPTQIHQLILNLTTNAVHAMRENGGLLQFGLEQTWLRGQHSSALPELQNGEYALLTVRDSGPGIDPEIQKHIFDPYFTTKSVGEGSGLGLAVVHGIVQSHGGAILVESALGQGACFRVYLPCCNGSSEKLPAHIIEVAKGQRHILLVDDEEAIVALGQRSLQKLGYHVTGVTRSATALKKFEENPLQFDLIIADQTMPQISGIALAQEIWKIRPGFPIIICTGYSEHLTSEKASELGFSDLLSKPYTVAELAKVIRKCLS